MSLLPLEPYLNPVNLLTDEPDEPDGTWRVLHVKPRAEKSLARKLLGRGRRFFLPLYRHQWQKGRRSFNSYLPLFPGYVFLHGDESDRLATLATGLVVRVLAVENQAGMKDDLMRVHARMASGAPVEPGTDLPEGSEVEITRGSLAGMQGRVLRRNGQCRFVVEVQFIRSAVSIELDSSFLAPCETRWAAAI